MKQGPLTEITRRCVNPLFWDRPMGSRQRDAFWPEAHEDGYTELSRHIFKRTAERKARRIDAARHSKPEPLPEATRCVPSCIGSQGHGIN
jgi:hypothetical protein